MKLKTFQRAAWGRLKTQSGAFDLPSIMIGVAVVAILTVGVLAAIFGVIPWAQDRAAQQDLAAVHTAQGAAYSKNGGFADRAGLVDTDLLGKDIPAELEIRAAADGLKYVGVNYSKTGVGYIITSEEPAPRELLNNDKWLDGGVIDPNARQAPPEPPIMVSTWKIAAGQTVTLPLAGIVNATIDWGDGSPVQTVTGASPSHTYPAANTAQVITITGTFDKWGGLYGWADSKHLVSVDSWGETGTTDLSNAFNGADQLKRVEAIPSTTTIMHGAFSYVDSDFTLGNLGTSKVTDMRAVFEAATAFDQPLAWDTSLVKHASGMFRDASAFNSPINFTNTSKFWDMRQMFVRAKSFDQPLEWDTSGAVFMNSMFVDATAFDQPLDWNTSKVQNVDYMFYGATSFNQDLSLWDVDKVLTNNNFASGTESTWLLPKPNFNP